MANGKPKFRLFRPQVLTRHPSHSELRRKHKRFPLVPFKSVIRLGSTTEVKDTIANGGKRVEINTIEAVRNSSSKIRMKEAFDKNNVPTPIWAYLKDIIQPKAGDTEIFFRTKIKGFNDSKMPYPVVVKAEFGSRGNGNTKINNVEEMLEFIAKCHKENKSFNNFIVEKFYNYLREYRIHVTKNGGFYFLRKMLKSDTEDDKKWFRNDKNCVWILQENELFDAPTNLKQIEKEGVNALQAVGLDVGAIDVKVQSRTKSDGKERNGDPAFTIIEINSAPSFGELTLEKYIEELPKLIKEKGEKNAN